MEKEEYKIMKKEKLVDFILAQTREMKKDKEKLRKIAEIVEEKK